MKTQKTIVKLLTVLLVTATLFAVSVLPTVAQESTPTNPTEQTVVSAEQAPQAESKALPAALVVGLAAAAGAISMGIAIAKSVDGISRQPEAAGNIRTSLMLGLIFIETVVIYALIVAILIVFIL